MHFQSADCWTNSYVVGKTSGDWEGEESLQVIQRLASENAVLIFSVSSCCMCHAVKRLLCGMGVNPTAYELDEQPRGKEIEEALLNLMGMGMGLGLGMGLGSSSVSVSVVPVVFIGGKLLGSMDAVMASHINGTLVPLLKEAGALWL